MTATAILDGPTASSRLDPPDPAMRDLALSAVEASLRADPQTLADRLLAYYAPSADECGTGFLDGTETESPGTVTAADLFAVTMLGIPVSRSAARRLLYDTPDSARIAGCLAPSRLPLDATLAEAGPTLIRAMAELHDAVIAAVDARPRPGAAGHVLASALCARKRPELFPVLDQPFSAALALPGAASPVPSWLVLRSVLRRPHVRKGLTDAFAVARGLGCGTPIDVYPLRQLYVLTCDLRATAAG
jgi:hypothetical protein